MSISSNLLPGAYGELLPSWWEVPDVDPAQPTYDAEMLALNAAGQALGPLPTWATQVRSGMPKWGIEMCAHRWLEGLAELIESISQERNLTSQAGHCGDLPSEVWDAVRARANALGRWLLDEAPAGQDDLALSARLGTHDHAKSQSARCLHALLDARLGRLPADEYAALAAVWQAQAAYDPLLAHLLAEHSLLDTLDNACGFLLLQRLDWALALIGGDTSHAPDRVGNCNAQLRLLWEYDQERYAVTRGYLWGLWAWLGGRDAAWLEQHLPECAPEASYVLQALSAPTDAPDLRRWLAASLLKTTTVWCQRALARSSGVAVPAWANDLPAGLPGFAA